MLKKLVYISLPLIAILVVISCCSSVRLVAGIIPFLGVLSDLTPNENRCLDGLPPSDFSESYLVGTWVARRLGDSDTLIISEGGTYKQIIHLEYSDYTGEPDVDYETDWQRWWLEYHPSGIPYLHLEGMRFCAINPSFNCEEPTGLTHWYDFCEDSSIAMDNEGILIVLGNSLAFPMGSENSWSYHLQEP